MKTGEKLKLLRALNGYSQEELGLLFGGSRELCALIESDKKELVGERAECIARIMHVDSEWLLNEENKQCLGSTGFALFVFDGEKKVGTTQTSQTRFIKAAVAVVESNLSKALAGGTCCYIGKTGNNNAGLVLFNLDGHGLMIKVVNCADMVQAVTTVAREVPGNPVDEQQIPDDTIMSVNYSNPDSIISFINKAGLDGGVKEGLASIVVEQSERLNVVGKKARRGKKSPVSADEARSTYARSIYESHVARISKEIKDYGINPVDLVGIKLSDFVGVTRMKFKRYKYRSQASHKTNKKSTYELT